MNFFTRKRILTLAAIALGLTFVRSATADAQVLPDGTTGTPTAVVADPASATSATPTGPIVTSPAPADGIYIAPDGASLAKIVFGDCNVNVDLPLPAQYFWANCTIGATKLVSLSGSTGWFGYPTLSGWYSNTTDSTFVSTILDPIYGNTTNGVVNRTPLSPEFTTGTPPVGRLPITCVQYTLPGFFTDGTTATDCVIETAGLTVNFSLGDSATSASLDINAIDFGRLGVNAQLDLITGATTMHSYGQLGNLSPFPGYYGDLADPSATPMK